MVFHETIEAQLKQQELDNEFSNKQKDATPEKTKEIKEEAGNIFWKNFNPDYKEKIIEEFQISEKINRLEDFPIIENLYKSWEINEETYLDLVEILENTDKKDAKKEIVNFLNENLKNSENFEKIKQFFSPKEKIDENNFDKSEFAKESKLWWIELDLVTWDLEIMLANNFVNISWENKEKSENINTSIDITLNKLINWKSTDFIENNWDLIWDIRKEENPNLKYWLIKKLYKEYLIDDAKFWWKKAKTEIAKKKETIENKTQKIKEQLQKQVETNEITQKQANQKFKKIQENLIQEWKNNSNLQKEIQKIEWAIESWELDKVSENVEEVKQ